MGMWSFLLRDRRKGVTLLSSRLLTEIAKIENKWRRVPGVLPTSATLHVNG